MANEPIYTYLNARAFLTKIFNTVFEVLILNELSIIYRSVIEIIAINVPTVDSIEEYVPDW